MGETNVKELTISDEPRNSLFEGKSSDYVKLNVGGCLFQTTVATLTKQEDTMLAAMFSGRMDIQTDPEGWIMIDRCGKHFGTILNFLRDGSVPLPNSPQDIAELCKEAEYYCIKDLEELCSRKPDLNNANFLQLVPKTKNDLITIVNNTSKPVVVFSMDLNCPPIQVSVKIMLNMLLFEKLSVKYQNCIVFAKDIISGNKSYQWRFYKKGKLLHTLNYSCVDRWNKICDYEYSEVRIYEEMLNLLA